MTTETEQFCFECKRPHRAEVTYDEDGFPTITRWLESHDEGSPVARLVDLSGQLFSHGVDVWNVEQIAKGLEVLELNDPEDQP